MFIGKGSEEKRLCYTDLWPVNAGQERVAVGMIVSVMPFDRLFSEINLSGPAYQASGVYWGSVSCHIYFGFF